MSTTRHKNYDYDLIMCLKEKLITKHLQLKIPKIDMHACVHSFLIIYIHHFSRESCVLIYTYFPT